MAYNLPFPEISAEKELPAVQSSDEINHTVYFNASTATALRVEAKIHDDFYVEVAAAQSEAYETYVLTGVTAWRLTPSGGLCEPFIAGSVGR